MTLRTKLLPGTILPAFAAFHAVTWYNVAAKTEPAALFSSD
jgi:hypothetical protein